MAWATLCDMTGTAAVAHVATVCWSADFGGGAIGPGGVTAMLPSALSFFAPGCWSVGSSVSSSWTMSAPGCDVEKYPYARTARVTWSTSTWTISACTPSPVAGGTPAPHSPRADSQSPPDSPNTGL